MPRTRAKKKISRGDGIVRLAVVNLIRGGASGGYRKYLEIIPSLLGSSPAISELEIFSPEGTQIPKGSRGHRMWPAAAWMTGYRDLKRALLNFEPDVIFIPTARIINTPFPTVLMVRNMEPLVAPLVGNSIRDGLKNIGRRLVALESCRRADRVIAVSPFVRDFLVRRWRLPDSKIGVVPHGAGTPLLSSSRSRPRVLDRLDRPMIFTAGSIRPSRGLEDVILALPRLAGMGLDLILVVAGKVSGDASRYRKALDKLIESHSLSGSVVWAGELSASEMAWCFAECATFVMTSRVEACPNTALEALAYGAPCVATSLRPMPETFGAAALYYEPGDSLGLADRLSTLLSLNESERSDLVATARRRGAEFTWQATADATIRQLDLARKQ